MKIIIILLLICSPVWAKEMYYSGLVKQDGFRQSWLDLIKGHKFRKEDGWITRHDGVRGPLESISVNGAQLLKDEGCQPHDCLDNSIVILIDRKTYKIWMVHRIISYPSREIKYEYFGKPDDLMKARLVSYLAKP